MAPKGPSFSPSVPPRLSLPPSFFFFQPSKASYFHHQFISLALHLFSYICPSFASFTLSSRNSSFPISHTNFISDTLTHTHTHSKENTKIETFAGTHAHTNARVTQAYVHTHTHTHTSNERQQCFFLSHRLFSHTQTGFPNPASLAGSQVQSSASKQTPSPTFSSSSLLLLLPLSLSVRKPKKSTNWNWQITHSELYLFSATRFFSLFSNLFRFIFRPLTPLSPSPSFSLSLSLCHAHFPRLPLPFSFGKGETSNDWMCKPSSALLKTLSWVFHLRGKASEKFLNTFKTALVFR